MGGAAAAIPGFLIWAVGITAWNAASNLVRGILIVLVINAVAVISKDIRARRFSLLTRVLVGAWILVGVLLMLAEIVIETFIA